MNARMAAVEAALGQALARPVRIERHTALAGGSINRTERLDTTAGPFVLKTHDSPPARFFEAEADGLTALASSGTSLRVPAVVAVGTDPTPFLILEFLAQGSPARDFNRQFGRGLAALHRVSAPRFGFAADNYCGLTPQQNGWCDSWVRFYAESRLGDQVARAARAGLLTPAETQRMERLLARLGTWLDEPPDGPSLLHGDLWSGNLHTLATGAPAILDPAAYYGDREAELGMMMLFGGFSSEVYATYDEVFPLERGWRERNPLYQLYHLLNHLNLFGASYHASVMNVVDAFA